MSDCIQHIHSLLEKVRDIIAKPLTVLYNLSFVKIIYPAVLKYATVIPIHMKNAKEFNENYKGLAKFTAVFGK